MTQCLFISMNHLLPLSLVHSDFHNDLLGLWNAKLITVLRPIYSLFILLGMSSDPFSQSSPPTRNQDLHMADSFIFFQVSAQATSPQQDLPWPWLSTILAPFVFSLYFLILEMIFSFNCRFIIYLHSPVSLLFSAKSLALGMVSAHNRLSWVSVQLMDTCH